MKKIILLCTLCVFIAVEGYSQASKNKTQPKAPPPSKTTQKKTSDKTGTDTQTGKTKESKTIKSGSSSSGNLDGFTFEVESNDEFYLLPADRSGFLTLYTKDEKKKGLINWIITLYDTTMHKAWETNIDTKKNLRMLDYRKTDDNIYIIYANGALPCVGHTEGDKAIDKDGLSILKIGLQDKQIKVVEASAPSNFIYSGMDLIGNDEVIINGLNNVTSRNMLFNCKLLCDVWLCCIPSIAGLMYIKDQPFAYSVNMKTGKKTVYPMNQKGNNYVSNVWTSSDKSCYFFCTNKPKPKMSNVFMYNLKDGSVKSTQNLNMSNGTVIKDLNGYDIDENRHLIIGIYGEEVKLSFFRKVIKIIINNANDINGDVADGICVNEIEGSKLTKTKKFDFSKVKNLKEVRSKANCVSNLCTGFSMHINKVINNGTDGFLVIAEGYNRVYEMHTRYVYDSHGGHTETYYIFIGFETIAGMVLQLDETGNLKWGQAFPVSQTLSSRVKNKIGVKKVAEDEYSLVYPFKDNICSRTLSGTHVSEESKKDEILSHIKQGNEKIKANNMSIEPWYDNNELVYGMEKVKQKGNGTHYKVYVNRYNYDY